MLTRIFNDLPGHWLEEIERQLEKNKELELKLICLRGSLVGLKRQYVKAVLDQLHYSWILYDGVMMKYQETTIGYDGGCYLVFNRRLPSGNLSKKKNLINWRQITELTWVSPP